MAQDTQVTPVVVASSTTYAQFVAGGLTAIAANLQSTNAAKANPTTALTATATGGGSTGGNLAAGVYQIAYTWVDLGGETTVGTGRIASALTVAAGNIPRVTIPSLPTGVSFANIYLSPPGGAAGSEILYASGVTTTTFDLSYAQAADPASLGLPTANTTGLSGPGPSGWLNAFNSGSNVEYIMRRFRDAMDRYLTQPVDRRTFRLGFFHLRAIAKTWDVMMSEAEVLAIANPGTVAWVTLPGAGVPALKRTP